MNPGLLNKRIQFQQQVTTKNDLGHHEKIWAPFCEAMAQVKPIKSSEVYSSHEFDSAIYYRVKMRFRKDITSSLRIVLDGQVLDITAPPVNERFENRFLVLEAVAR